MSRNNLTTAELKILCDTAIELTNLKYSECSHLAIENFTPKLLNKLIVAVLTTRAEQVEIMREIEVSL